MHRIPAAETAPGFLAGEVLAATLLHECSAYCIDPSPILLTNGRLHRRNLMHPNVLKKHAHASEQPRQQPESLVGCQSAQPLQRARRSQQGNQFPSLLLWLLVQTLAMVLVARAAILSC
jgi:hypothetical protein